MEDWPRQEPTETGPRDGDHHRRRGRPGARRWRGERNSSGGRLIVFESGSVRDFGVPGGGAGKLTRGRGRNLLGLEGIGDS